jgi:NADH-quinone oxidoreductase subunit G
MDIGSRNEVIHRQTPRENNDVNSAWMCDAGRLDFHYVNSEARLTQPTIKENGTHRAADWQDALAKAATALQSVPPSQIAMIASGRMTNEELFLTKRLAISLGVTHLDIVPRTGEADNYLVHADKNPNTAGARLILGTEPGSQLAAIRDKVDRGEITTVIALQENLLGEAGFTSAQLGKLQSFIVGHILANPSAEPAHVVLPLAAYAEKRGSLINATGRLQRLNKATEPAGEARSDWEVLRDLTLAVSGQNGLYSIEDVFKSMAAAISPFAGLNLGKIGDTGLPLLETTETIPVLEREKERKAKGIIVG